MRSLSIALSLFQFGQVLKHQRMLRTFLEPQLVLGAGLLRPLEFDVQLAQNRPAPRPNGGRSRPLICFPQSILHPGDRRFQIAPGLGQMGQPGQRGKARRTPVQPSVVVGCGFVIA